MLFSQYLKDQLNITGITQSELVRKLHTVSTRFSSLDPITLNRWLNNKTTPTKDRQIVIARFFERSMEQYINLVDAPTVPQSFLYHYNKIFSNIENSYCAISYNYSTKQKILKMERLRRREARQKLEGFYNNIDGYRRAFEINGSSTLHLPTTLLTINQGEKIISHLSFQDDIKKTMNAISEVIGREIDVKPQALLSNIGYYSSRGHYQLIVGHLLNNILDEYSEYRYLYSITRSSPFLQLLQLMGGEVLHSKRESMLVGNCYLVRFSIDELIAHPFVLSQIYNTRESYQNLKKNGQTLI